MKKIEMLVGSSLQAFGGKRGEIDHGLVKLECVRDANIVVATAGAFEHCMCKVNPLNSGWFAEAFLTHSLCVDIFFLSCFFPLLSTPSFPVDLAPRTSPLLLFYSPFVGVLFLPTSSFGGNLCRER